MNVYQVQESEPKAIIRLLQQIKGQKKGQNLENVVNQVKKLTGLKWFMQLSFLRMDL